MDHTSKMYGFEMLQKLTENQVKKKEDILVLFAHWFLTKIGFRCIGIGDSKSFDSSEPESELLPEGWNTQTNYALRYKQYEKLYLLHGTKSDEDLLLSFLRVEDNNVSTVHFPIEQTVNNLHGSMESLMPRYQSILHTIRTDLVSPVFPGNTRDSTSQTSKSESRDPTCRHTGPLRVTPPPPLRQPWTPEIDPYNVGRADLHPFARGGGMIFDGRPGLARNPDFHGPGIGIPGRLPPGAVPPGARFDPFGPPDVNLPRPNPNNDHMPPPGYDDMFM